MNPAPPVSRPPATATTPPRAAMPPMRPPAGPPMKAAKSFAFGKIEDAKAQRIGIYGGGGLGKTTLACAAPGPVGIFDFDHSLPTLKPTLAGLDVRPISGVETYDDMLQALHAPMWSDIKTIVIDSATKAQELAEAYTIKNVKHEKGHTVNSIEGYGFGKGYVHMLDTWLLLLQSLDAHNRAGRNVIIIMHDCVQLCPNPEGEDYKRWEPRLQNTDKGNIRSVTKEWLDHLLCIRLDLDVKEGKAKGGHSRTIYPVESAVHVAKSRSLRDPIVYDEGSTELWKQLFGE